MTCLRGPPPVWSYQRGSLRAAARLELPARLAFHVWWPAAATGAILTPQVRRREHLYRAEAAPGDHRILLHRLRAVAGTPTDRVRGLPAGGTAFP